MARKIIHIITTIDLGGAEKQLLILVQQQIAQGIDVEVFPLKGRLELKNEFEDSGVKVNLSLINKNFVFQVFLFKKYLSRKEYLVHAHLSQAELISTFACSSKRFIISRHNYHRFWPNKPRIISKILSKFISNRAACCIVISNAVKEYLIKNRELVNEIKIFVIHYGLDIKNSRSILQNQDSQFNIGGSEYFRIGTIGRLVSGKNHRVMLYAMQQVVSKIPNVRLYLVGSGECENDLRKLSTDLKIEAHVIWIGRTSYIQEFLGQVDLFIFASRGEGFGLVLLEAMQSKKPILAPNNSAIPEILGANYPGLYPTGDHNVLAEKIMDIYNSAKLRDDLVSTYSSQFELFDPKQMSRKILSVYESIGFSSKKLSAK